jgi:hypothetical protein
VTAPATSTAEKSFASFANIDRSLDYETARAEGASVAAIDMKSAAPAEMPMRFCVDNAALLRLGARIASMQYRHWMGESAMVKLLSISS